MQGFDFVFACLAALAAGAVNALAGGGTLITFTMLTFLGVPAVAANITNTVALCPGYFGGTLAQWKDLRGQQDRLWLVVPASIVGGVLGGYLLLQTGERLFRERSGLSLARGVDMGVAFIVLLLVVVLGFFLAGWGALSMVGITVVVAAGGWIAWRLGRNQRVSASPPGQRDDL